MVWPDSARRSSIQVSGSASDAPCPWSRRANSATKAFVSGGAERAMSATMRIRSLGTFSATSTMLSAQTPAVSRSPVGRGDARRDATQVLDQREPQHDRNRPQLAQQQRLDRLVGGNEAHQRAATDRAVAVRDELQREVIDARHARRARALSGLCARRGSSRL